MLAAVAMLVAAAPAAADPLGETAAATAATSFSLSRFAITAFPGHAGR